MVTKFGSREAHARQASIICFTHNKAQMAHLGAVRCRSAVTCADSRGAPSSAEMSTLPAGDPPREDREARARMKGSSEAALGARHSRRWTRMLPRPAAQAWHECDAVCSLMLVLLVLQSPLAGCLEGLAHLEGGRRLCTSDEAVHVIM